MLLFLGLFDVLGLDSVRAVSEVRLNSIVMEFDITVVELVQEGLRAEQHVQQMGDNVGQMQLRVLELVAQVALENVLGRSDNHFSLDQALEMLEVSLELDGSIIDFLAEHGVQLAEVSHIDTVAVHVFGHCLRVGWDTVARLEVVNGGLELVLNEELSELFDKSLISGDFIFLERELYIRFEDVVVEFVLGGLLEETLDLLYLGDRFFLVLLLEHGLLLVGQRLTLLGLGLLRALSLKLLSEVLHLATSILHVLVSEEQINELRSHQRRVIIITHEVSVPRRQSLQVNDVSALISTADSLDLDRASDLDDRVVGLVNNFVDFDVESVGNLGHQGVELFVGDDVFLVVDGTVLGEGGQVVVIEDAGDDRLADHAVT